MYDQQLDLIAFDKLGADQKIDALRLARRRHMDTIKHIDSDLEDLYQDAKRVPINREQTLYLLKTRAGKSMLAFHEGNNTVAVSITEAELRFAADLVNTLGGLDEK